MALGYENGRTPEIEAILGNTLIAGRRLAVATPTLEAIYALAKMVENKKGWRSEEVPINKTAVTRLAVVTW
jgi:ketopantoate reductase